MVKINTEVVDHLIGVYGLQEQLRAVGYDLSWGQCVGADPWYAIWDGDPTVDWPWGADCVAQPRNYEELVAKVAEIVSAAKADK